jgi:hypothetical protein
MVSVAAGAGTSLSKRWLLTLALCALPLLGDRVPLPGVDTGAFTSPEGSSHDYSIFALGLSPLISSYVTVELATLLVPKLRKLRHQFPSGRRRLWPWVLALAIVLATAQGYALTLVLSQLAAPDVGWSLAERIVPLLTLVAVTAVASLAAAYIERLGLLNGVVALELVSRADQALSGPWPRLPGETLGLVAALLAATLPILATVVLAVGKNGRPAPGLGVPTSSIQPLIVGGTLLTLPAVLLNYDESFSDLVAQIEAFRIESSVGLVALLGVLFAWLMQRPSAVAKLLTRVDEAAPVSVARARQELWRSLFPTFGYLFTLLGAGLLASASSFDVAPLPLALGTALLLDALDNTRLALAGRDWIKVWDERRPHAVPAIVAAAARQGIALRAGGSLLTQLLRVFGPWTYTGLWCAPEDASRARELLAQLLDDSGTAPEHGGAASTTAAWKDARTLALAGLTAASFVGLRLVTSPPTFAGAPASGSFELSLIDDRERFANVDERALPAGVSVSDYDVLVNRDQVMLRPHYVRLVPQDGESFDRARARIEPWLSSITLEPHERFAWEALEEMDDAGKIRIAAYRAYVLHPPTITASDVTSITTVGAPDGETALAVHFSEAGTERFRRLTREHIKERIAIAVHGMVTSTPIVQSEISRGPVQITLGMSDTPAEGRAKAEALVRSLTGQPK